ncbi:MAG: transcriptional regulator [Planctomycetes bacterium]|nr:transcriptional regulator [Planctomycetota bacterium]
MTVEELDRLLAQREDEHLEVKEAKSNIDSEDLLDYCAAMANEGGGRIVLGVTNRRPRTVVGTSLFQGDGLERKKHDILTRLRLRVDMHEVQHPGGRVIVLDVPPHPPGTPVERPGGRYLMRSGESLVGMSPDMLRRIFSEVATEDFSAEDFSAEVCCRASFVDLDAHAVAVFRERWARKTGSERILGLSDEQLLRDAELLQPDGLTYAALILLGAREALGRLNLAHAEVIFEYRSSEAAGPAQDRKEYRAGFLGFHDDLWNTINLRNDKQHYQEGLFVWDIPTFSEPVVREAILNAVSHRDYRDPGSVFVRQYARKLEVMSPGGFPRGITPENVLWTTPRPRNRRIADTLERCGLVERAGQGVRLMFETSIRQSKPSPDFSGSGDYQVAVRLSGEVQDTNFVRFLEKVGKERGASFSTQDLLLLDLVNRGAPVPQELRARVHALVDEGVLERIGRGRGIRLTLSRKFYHFAGKKGAYTRLRGLDRETSKALLLRHLEDNREQGSPLSELNQVLPGLSVLDVQNLLRELKVERRAHCVGRTKRGLWLPGAGP